MTFFDRYKYESTWQGRVQIMEIYHLAMSVKAKGWTIKDTSGYFNVSIGLVSENLKIALASHINPNILKCESRQEALKKLSNGG